MAERIVSLGYTDQEFPEGTVAGSVFVSVTDSAGVVQRVELSGAPETATFTLLGGETYIIAAWRTNSLGEILGTPVTITWNEPVTTTVIISVPSAISVV